MDRLGNTQNGVLTIHGGLVIQIRKSVAIESTLDRCFREAEAEGKTYTLEEARQMVQESSGAAARPQRDDKTNRSPESLRGEMNTDLPRFSFRLVSESGLLPKLALRLCVFA
jgi:hypothetical protein